MYRTMDRIMSHPAVAEQPEEELVSHRRLTGFPSSPRSRGYAILSIILYYPVLYCPRGYLVCMIQHDNTG